MTFCSSLKLRGLSSVAGHIVTLEKSWVPWQTGVTEVTLNYSARQNSYICPCKLSETSANKLGICYMCVFMYHLQDAHVQIIC